MIRLSLASVLCAILAAPCAAQVPCSNLSVSGTGHRGTMMTFALTNGSAGAASFLVVGMQQGHTQFDFGMMGSLHLGLSGPLHLLPMGMTDNHGTVHLTLQVPHGLMVRSRLLGQGFTMLVHRRTHRRHGYFEFCTSNVSGFLVGGRHGG